MVDVVKKKKAKPKNKTAKISKQVEAVKNEFQVPKDKKEVFNRAAENDPRIWGAVQALQQSINRMSKQSGNASLRSYAFSKASSKDHPVRTVPQLRAALIREGVPEQEVQMMNNSELVKLVALDDWSSIWETARPLLKHLGWKALSWAYKRVRPYKDDLGGDEGYNPIDWPSGGVLNPARISLLPGLNVVQPGVKDSETLYSGPDLVSGKSLQTSLCPELYKHRYTYIESTKVALAVPVLEVPVVTSSGGQVALVVPVNGVVKAAAAYLYNAATLNIVTGIATVGPTTYASTISGSTSILSYRICGFSIQVIPNSSLATTGSFTLALCNRPALFSEYGLLNIGMTLDNLKTQTYVTSFNTRTTARMVSASLSHVESDLVEVGTNVSTGAFYLFGSGLPISTEVARAVITYNVEFIPTPAAMPLCVTDSATPGPMTEQFESFIFTRHPVLQSLDLVDAKMVAAGIGDAPRPYAEMTELIYSLVTGIRPRQYFSHTVPISSIPAIPSGGASSSSTSTVTKLTEPPPKDPPKYDRVPQSVDPLTGVVTAWKNVPIESNADPTIQQQRVFTLPTDPNEKPTVRTNSGMPWLESRPRDTSSDAYTSYSMTGPMN